MIRWLATALAAFFLTTAAVAPATAQTVQQSGTVSNGHVGTWITSGLIKDGGSPSNFQTNALGLYNGTNSPLGISSQTGAGALSGTWGTFTLGSTSSAASLTTLNSAGTAQPLNINVGGDATYVIGGTNWLSTIFGQQFCTTTGAVLYRDSGGTWKCLGPGTSGQVLQTQGPNLNPQWAGSGGIGTVTSITAGTGLSGGTITTSGTIALLNPVAVNLGGTGAATLAAHGVLIGNGTTAVNVATPGVAGTVLQSNGAGADPTWNAVAGTGTVTSITAGSTRITVSPSPLTTSGTIDCATATSSQIGCSKPDGTTITASAGTVTAANTTIGGTACTPGSSCTPSTTVAGATCTLGSTCGFSTQTFSLSGNVGISNSVYSDGPSVTQGASGTWLATGTVVVMDTAVASQLNCKLWDGTTVMSSGAVTVTAANTPQPLSLSGTLATPAAGIRISCKASSSATSEFIFNASGNSKDSTLTVVRIN